MDSKAGKGVDGYSLMDHETQSSPYEFYAVLHRECPIYRMPETGMFVVTKYDDVRHVLRDPEVFSNKLPRGHEIMGKLADVYEGLIADKGWAHVPTLQLTDPPEHARYRKLLDRVFTASRVREIQPHIDDLANGLIDSWIGDGECEFNMQFAMPLPGILLAEQLGLDSREIVKFRRWADAIIAPSNRVMTEEELRANAEEELEMQHFLAAAFESRRTDPTGDLISALVHAQAEDAEPLTMAELQGVMAQLVAGGFETTQSAICHGMWRLVRSPELLPRLRANPDLIKAFCEETLRMESPVQSLVRLVTRDAELNGTVMPAGSLVLVRYGAANRDPDRFECPHAFELDRRNAGAHLAFGSGAHFCVGASLARQEMASAFKALATRLDNIELARDLPYPAHAPSLNFLPMRELHIRFGTA